MKHISLPWGSVILEADSPRRYELVLESIEDSLRRRCYLRLDFDPGEWTLTLNPHESVVCDSCGHEDGRVNPGGILPCGRCKRRELTVITRLLRREAAILPRADTRSDRGSVVRLAAWGRYPRRS
jgi:hypothetical protein